MIDFVFSFVPSRLSSLTDNKSDEEFEEVEEELKRTTLKLEETQRLVNRLEVHSFFFSLAPPLMAFLDRAPSSMSILSFVQKRSVRKNLNWN